MKKTFILSALSALLLISCDVTDERFAPVPQRVYASQALNISLADSTEISASRGLSAWKLKDTCGYYYTCATEGLNAGFTLDDGQNVPTYLAYAVYPEAKVDSIRTGVIHLNLTDKQTAAVGTAWDCIYAGPISANEARLQRASGIIRFTVGCEGAGCCEISSLTEAPLAGTATVRMTRDIVMKSSPGTALRTIALSGDLQKDSTYAIAVLPGTYKFSYSFQTSNGMPIGGDSVEGEYTVATGEEKNIGVLGDNLPPSSPGDRIVTAEEYTGYENIPNGFPDGSSISLLLAGVNEKYDIKDGAGTAKATFHGNEMSDWRVYGVEPYDENASLAGDVVSATLNPVQTLTAGVHNRFALAKVNESTGYIDAKNAAALLRFEITQGDIAEVVIRGNSGEILAGAVNMVWNEGDPAWTATAGVDSLILRPSAGSTFAAGIYYASVLPQTLGNGYTVLTKSAAGKNSGMSYSGSAAKLIRSTVVNIGKIPETKLGSNELKASADGFSGDETISATWPMGSAISVIASGRNEKYLLIKGGATGKFGGEEISGSSVYGVYPYDAGATCSEGTFTATLSSSRKIAPGVPEGFAVAVMNAATSTLEFRNVAGLLKFEIRGDNIGEIIIKSNGGEALAGKVNVSWNGGTPTFTVVEGSDQISLKSVGGSAFAPGIYYAAVLPQSLGSGVTVTCKSFAFPTDAVVKQTVPNLDLVRALSSGIAVSRSGVSSVGSFDRGYLWENATSGRPVRLAGLRGTDKNHGLYIDFSTGRSFYAIGAYAYSANCDLTMITNSSNGIAPSSVKAAAGFTNAANLGKFGTATEKDEVGNSAWKVKSDNTFCYVSAAELSDEQYKALTTVAQLKDIYEAHSAGLVDTYYSGNCVTNANRTSSNKYLIIKTENATEGTGYGIIKFTGLAGGTWYIEFNYKFGLE